MIWAALLIGATVLLAIWVGRAAPSRAAVGAPRNWLVLPEPRPGLALALPKPACSTLPALAVIYPAWSAANEDSHEAWRAEKPMRPWFRGAAPYAVAMALGAISLDLSAAGLGVPEIFPTHLPVHHERQIHGHGHGNDPAGLALDRSFGAWTPDHAAALAGEGVAWAKPDFVMPSWDRPHDHGHDWWA